MKRALVLLAFLSGSCLAAGGAGGLDFGDASGGSSSLTSSGTAVSGGTNNAVLYINGQGVLASSGTFLFNDQTNVFTLTGGTIAGNMTFSGTPSFNGGVNLLGTNSLTATTQTLGWNGPSGTNDIWTATGTFNNNVNGEQQLFKFDGTTSSTQTGQLSSTIWAYMHDNSSGTVTTAHTGAIFGRVFGSTQSADFMFGVEGNSQNHSLVSGGVSTTGAGIGVIGHAIWNGLSNSTPTVPTIGVEARAEITDPSISVNKTGARLSDVVAFRGETYQASTSTWDSRNYLLYGAVGGSDVAKIVTNGPIMSIPPSAQTIVSGGTILSDACGGVKQITSAGAVATDSTNAFSVPSISTTGTANTGCVMDVVNSGGNLITIKNSATILTYAGEDVNLNSGGASVRFISNGANWVQVSPISFTSLASVYLSSVTAGVSLSNAAFVNTGTITLTPGDWRVNASCDELANGATVTGSTVAVSVNSGNTTTDHVTGANQLSMFLPTTVFDGSGSIVNYRLAVASNTQIWVKIKSAFSVATPTASCSITADRKN